MTCGIMEVKPEISANISQNKNSIFLSFQSRYAGRSHHANTIWLFWHFFYLLPQKQPQIHQSACPSHLRSRQAADLGLTSAPSVTRTWWTRSSTPVDTCVCATPAASSSRRCPMPVVQSAGGKSKTLSRPIGAHKGKEGLPYSDTIPESG